MNTQSKMYLVIHSESNNFEVILKDKNDFSAWLKKHNEEREDELPEHEHEFILKPLNIFYHD